MIEIYGIRLKLKFLPRCSSIQKRVKYWLKKTLLKPWISVNFKKKASIKLIPSASNKVEIVNQGTDLNNKEEKSIEKIIVPIETNKKVKIKMKKQDLPENVETQIIVPIEPKKRVKIK